MSTQLQDRPDVTVEENQPPKRKKTRGTILWILLILFLILFLITTAILGSRLFMIATQDKYTVDLEVGMDGELELFKIEYENATGDITVQGTNGENVVAPGTSVEYAVRLRNQDDVAIDYLLVPTTRFLTEDAVPLDFKLIDTYGNYLVGTETEWGTPEELSALTHRGTIHPGEVFSYQLLWRWEFEVGQEEDEYDTYLGNQNGAILPGVEVGFVTEAAANTTSTRHPYSMMHLLGDGFGCCWCCYLVWILLLVIVLMLLWVWRLRRKVRKHEDLLEEYEEVLTANGLMVDGELVEHEKILQ